MSTADAMLTAAELAARWKLTTPAGGPNAARVVDLINRGELPGAFATSPGGNRRGPRGWRIPLAAVEGYERRHAARGPEADTPAPRAAPPGKLASPSGTDGKTRLGGRRAPR